MFVISQLTKTYTTSLLMEKSTTPIEVKMNKRSQELSVQTIVVAILALLVLVVVIMIFTGGVDKIREVISGLGKCESQGEGAYCINEEETCAGIKMKLNCPEGQTCCIPKGEE